MKKAEMENKKQTRKRRNEKRFKVKSRKNRNSKK